MEENKKIEIECTCLYEMQNKLKRTKYCRIPCKGMKKPNELSEKYKI